MAVSEVFKLSRIELDVEVLRPTRTRPGVVLPHLVDPAQRLPAHDDPLDVWCKQRRSGLSIVVDQDLAPPADDLHVLRAHASDFTPEASGPVTLPWRVACEGRPFDALCTAPLSHMRRSADWQSSSARARPRPRSLSYFQQKTTGTPGGDIQSLGLAGPTVY